MPQFSYKARKRSGELVTGVLEVGDRAAALSQIQKMGLFPITVDGGGAASGKAKGSKKAVALPPILQEWANRQRRPKLTELANFTTQLANLLKAGMPLTKALQSLSHIESKGIPKEVTVQLKQDVVEGKGLSEAMKRQPVIFSDMYINMVKAGEQSGALEQVLRKLADHYERFSEVQSKFTQAMVYPAFVALTGVLIIVIFVTKMLPTFMGIFEGMKIELPLSTQILMKVSNFFQSPLNLLIMALSTIMFVSVFMRFRSMPNGRRALDGWKMGIPVVGRVVKLNLFAQFARTLATLLRNGVNVLNALTITEEVVPNVVLKESIAKTRDAVTDGKTLAEPLAKSGVFPQLMIDLIKIGEETGDVPGALENVADTYENQMNVALRLMTNLIEPLLIITMALGVGFLLLGVLSAMFKLTSNIAR
ncbi:MAG: type II secretion system protein [Verrucomicrobiales bacterium]|nr:type II secretion system protein [Verrucomicrobiales bacterium]